MMTADMSSPVVLRCGTVSYRPVMWVVQIGVLHTLVDTRSARVRHVSGQVQTLAMNDWGTVMLANERRRSEKCCQMYDT